jgi:hypothetical protein
VVSVTPPPLYPSYPLDRRLNQNRSEPCETEKSLAFTRTRTPNPRPSSPYPAVIQTALSRLSPSNEYMSYVHLYSNRPRPYSISLLIYRSWSFQFYLTEYNLDYRGADARIGTHNNKFVKNADKIVHVLIKHHAMKARWGVEVYVQDYVTSAQDGDKRLALRPGGFTTCKSPPCTYWIGSQISPRAGLCAVQKRKYSMAQN